MKPVKISVLGQTWTIVFKNKIFLHRDGKEIPCHGLTHLDKKIIEIEKNLPAKRMLEVILHEYIHAVWDEAGFWTEPIPEWVEHMLIVVLSKDMARNKKFFKNLFSS